MSTEAILTPPGSDPGVCPPLLPASPPTLHRVAFGARIALLPGSLLALLAAIINRPATGGLLAVVTIIGALGLATVVILRGTIGSAEPRLDLGAFTLAMLLAGGAFVQGFGILGVQFVSRLYVLPTLAWLTLICAGLALASTLRISAPAQAPVWTRTPAATNSPPAWGPPPPAAAAPPPPPTPAPTHPAPAPALPPTPTPPAAAGPQPGWYPAPGGTTARWWDGKAWTGDERDLSEFPASGGAPSSG